MVTANPMRSGRGMESGQGDFEELKRLIHGKLVDKLDLSRLGDLEGDTLRREIRLGAVCVPLAPLVAAVSAAGRGCGR